MNNKERVDLNINIQLQSLRAAFAELNKIQTKVQEIQTGKAASNPATRMIDKSIMGFKDYEYKLDKIRWKKEYDADQERSYLNKNNKLYLAGVEQRRASMSEWDSQKLAGIKTIESAEQAATAKDLDRRQGIMRQIVAERQAKIDAVKSVKAEVAKAADEEKTMWTNAIKQAFSLHIIQMYVQPFVQALNTLIRTTLTTFAEFDAYYADYLAKSADFADVVSRGDIYSGAVNQVYSINNMADAMERFSASGIDLTQNQHALTDVLHLSVTAAITYDDAANTVIKTQEAFQLSINDSTMIVDALTNSANASTAELKDLTEWFGYASGMSHEAGINVQQLAAYLGILSSMGMKSAGTAFRQMLVQMTDTNVRDKLNAVFGQDFDYMDMDQTILRMREYVQTSSNQAEVIQRISGALGGKVNAREALARLLTADEQTWNRIMSATERSGTAATLFDNMTNNAAANMQKIKNNITLIFAQIGEIFSPILEYIVTITGWIATLVNAMPTFAKQLIGLGILIAGALATAILGFMTLVGLFYMVYAANKMFEDATMRSAFSVRRLALNLKQLSVVLLEHITLTEAAAVAENNQARATATNLKLTSAMKGSMLAGIGAMVSYMGYQYAMEEQSYALASALNIVSSALTGIMIGTMVGGPIGAVIGGALGLGMAYSGQSKIDRAKEESTASRRKSAWYGKNDVTQFNDTGAKNYFSINSVNLNGVQDANSMATELLYESDY